MKSFADKIPITRIASTFVAIPKLFLIHKPLGNLVSTPPNFHF